MTNSNLACVGGEDSVSTFSSIWTHQTKDLLQYLVTSEKITSSTWTHQRTLSSTQTHHKKGPSSLLGHITQRTFTSAWTHQTKALLQYLDIGPSPLPYATESNKFISLKINIQMGQPERVTANERTVPYTVLWPEFPHYRHLSKGDNASASNVSNHQRLWQVKTYFQYTEWWILKIFYHSKRQNNIFQWSIIFRLVKRNTYFGTRIYKICDMPGNIRDYVTLPSTHFQVHYSLMIQTFNIIPCQLFITSLNI